MTITRTGIAAGFLACLPLSALSDDNSAYIEQVGTRNSAVQMQVGSANASIILQPGAQNVQSTRQFGFSNRAQITQEGDNLRGYVLQGGIANEAIVRQTQNSAPIRIRQFGAGLTVFVHQD